MDDSSTLPEGDPTPIISEKVKKRVKKGGARFLFEYVLEWYHDDIIKGLRKYMASIKPEDIPTAVKETHFPSLEKFDFGAVADQAEHLESINELRLMEFIAEARPDLATAIQEQGDDGAMYIAKLRQHLLHLVKHPEKAVGQSTDYKPEAEMAKATCDKCGKSWVIPKAEASQYDKCPFCGAGKEQV